MLRCHGPRRGRREGSTQGVGGVERLASADPETARVPTHGPHRHFLKEIGGSHDD
jgi:hypothetical protein